MHFLNFELCIILSTVIFIFRSGNSWLYYTLGPWAFRWLSPPRLALLSWISVKRLSYGPPKDVTQEGKSGFSAQFVLWPSDCMKLLPQMKFCLHRLLPGRGRLDVLSRSGQLSQPLRVGWHPLRLAGMLLYILFQTFWPTIVPDVLPHVRVCHGLLQSFLDAQHTLGSSPARDPEETLRLEPKSSPLLFTLRENSQLPLQLPKISSQCVLWAFGLVKACLMVALILSWAPSLTQGLHGLLVI